jgi:hypothetical protein
MGVGRAGGHMCHRVSVMVSHTVVLEDGRRAGWVFLYLLDISRRVVYKHLSIYNNGGRGT